jgi:hypothetical protein
VAIVQISRVTARKGLEVDLPQPLAGGELGWALDTRQLFIGNGTLEDGAPVVGNTEILTEFSDILGAATAYTYKGEAAGYAVQTGATSGTPVSQSLQRRLDSYAIITDFGPTGDGVTDVTADINRAMYQIYCRDINPQIRRSLFFPAGVYVITDTLDIPPYAKLYGEGAESTIIYFYVQPHTSTVAYASGVLVSSGGSYYRSLNPVPIGTLISNATYWAVEALPSYIVRTADSLQQVDVNITTNGASAPGNVEVSGIKFLTNVDNNALLVEDANQCYFDAVAFEGPLVQADLNAATEDIAAVRWSSTVSLICRDVTFNNCSFSGFSYATNTDQQIEGVTFSNSVFDTLHQGIVLGDISPVNGGPTGVRITQNRFNNIYNQGIVFDNVSMNISAYNSFYDVGNHFQGYANPATAVIDMGSNNASVGDMFGRNTSQSVLYPRIELNDTNAIAMGMNNRGITFYQAGVQDLTIANNLNLGTYTRSSGIEDVIDDNNTVSLVTVSSTLATCFKIDYTIRRNTAHRSGTLTVASGTGFVYTDDYVENSSTGVTLTVTDNTGSVTVGYTATSTGVDGSIHYSITTLG